MTALLSTGKTVAGYEANGGFLQASVLKCAGKVMTPLPTRDAAIVPLAILLFADSQSLTISALLKTLPARYTASDRLKQFPTDVSQAILAEMKTDDRDINLAAIAQRFPDLWKPVEINIIYGVRITFESGDIVHLRPSGNAPELRCYTESATEEQAVKLNKDLSLIHI